MNIELAGIIMISHCQMPNTTFYVARRTSLGHYKDTHTAITPQEGTELTMAQVALSYATDRADAVCDYCGHLRHS